MTKDRLREQLNHNISSCSNCSSGCSDRSGVCYTTTGNGRRIWTWHYHNYGNSIKVDQQITHSMRAIAQTCHRPLNHNQRRSLTAAVVVVAARSAWILPIIQLTYIANCEAVIRFSYSFLFVTRTKAISGAIEVICEKMRFCNRTWQYANHGSVALNGGDLI